MSQAPFGSGAPTPGEGAPFAARTPPPPARGGKRASGPAVPPWALALVAGGVLVAGGLAWYALSSGGGDPVDASATATSSRAASPSGATSGSPTGAADEAGSATRNPFAGGPVSGNGGGTGAGTASGTGGGTGSGTTSTSTSTATSTTTTAAPTTAATTPASTPTVTVHATTTKTVTATATSTAVYVFLSGWGGSLNDTATLWVNTTSATLNEGDAAAGVTFVQKDATSGCAVVKLSSGGASKQVCAGDAVQLA